MPAVGVRVLAAFLLGACLLGLILYSSRSCHAVGFPTGGSASVAFELMPVLATVPGQARVLACVEQTCVLRGRSSFDQWPFLTVNAAFTDPETIDVRVVVRGRSRSSLRCDPPDPI